MAYDDNPLELQQKLLNIRRKAEANQPQNEQEELLHLAKTKMDVAEVSVEEISYDDFFYLLNDAKIAEEEKNQEQIRERLIDHLIKSDFSLEGDEND